MQEIKKWIEVPHVSIAQIKLFIKEWKKIQREEISSQICKNDIELRNAHFQEVDDILDLFFKWRYALEQG